MVAEVHPSDAAALLGRLAGVRDAIAAAEQRAGRPQGAVELLPVTKTVPSPLIAVVLGAGLRAIGENRVQEIEAKAQDLAAYPHRVHMIGHLQRNKVGRLPGLVSCVQSVDSAEVARQLDARWRAAALPPLDVLVQVNVSGEPTKAGCHPQDALELCAAVGAHSHLALRGLMTIGAHTEDMAEVARGFAVLREVRDAVVASGEPGTADARELSMGMSADLDAAIAEGSTMVRVGSAIFGARPRSASLGRTR